MKDNSSQTRSTAIMDFRQARMQADLKELIGSITGEPTQLLSFDEVRQKLRLQSTTDLGTLDIPLDAIVGSVGRYTDFTRGFLPRRKVQPERWANVKIAASGLIGLPPIYVYKIGEVYFVMDGNHRVSVARQSGAKFIQAYVTEVYSSIPLSPDVKPDDLILKAEYALFLEKTHLDQIKPKPDLTITEPGKYQRLLEHIDVHRYFMGIDYQRDVEYAEAVNHLYEYVYLPVVNIIREQGILRHFPGRTETDLYLWIAEYRTELEEELGWKIKTEYAATTLAEEQRITHFNVFSWLGDKLIKLILPEKEEDVEVKKPALSPLKTTSDDTLISDILVPVNGRPDGWRALDQAIIIARHEKATLRGLHVISDQQMMDEPSVLEVRDTFNQRCVDEGVDGSLKIVVGNIVDVICTHALGTDLVVVKMSFPPASQPLARLSPGFHDLVRLCPRPLFVAQQTVPELHCALLAYDESPKSDEALYFAAYLAKAWDLLLTVTTIIEEGRTGEDTLKKARQYLSSLDIQADYVIQAGPTAESIIKLVDERDCDLIISGGYGSTPIMQIFTDSTVDQVLRESQKPLLICR